MSDFDDEQDVPFADHSADGAARDGGPDRDRDRADDRDSDHGGGRVGGDHDVDHDVDHDGDHGGDEWTGPRAGGGAGSPLGEIGDLAGEARKAFGMLRGFVAPLLENYPEVREHLGAAGAEVANAYRAVIRGREQEWRDEGDDAERITVEQIDDVDVDVEDDGDSDGSGGTGGAGDDRDEPGDPRGRNSTD